MFFWLSFVEKSVSRVDGVFLKKFSYFQRMNVSLSYSTQGYPLKIHFVRHLFLSWIQFCIPPPTHLADLPSSSQSVSIRAPSTPYFSTFLTIPLPLKTPVCAIASRYYTPRRAIYKYAMHFAKVLAGSYLVNGWKTVELCQAYILLSTFSMPAKKWEEDRSRLYLELAIR